MTELPNSPRKAWLVTTAVYLAAVFFWCVSQWLCFTLDPLNHPHPTEAQQPAQKYD